MLEGAETLLVAKGKKYLRIDLNSPEATETNLLALMLGPSGNLRAPTIKIGKKVLVGFHDEAYEETLLH